MKRIFTLIGICTVLGIGICCVVFISGVLKFVLPGIFRSGGKGSTFPTHPGTVQAETLPSYYHQNGKDSHMYQEQKDGITIATKLGSDIFHQTGYLFVKLAADKDMVLPPRQNLPLNVAIVVDRSGSMQGSKLESVKQALLNVSSLFTERDQVALVVYDDDVQTLYSGNFHRVEFESLVRHITSGGSTNLEGGLKAGLLSVQNVQEGMNFREQPDMLNHVLLLSDGLANVGLDSPTALASMVEKYQDSDVTVSTVGVGSDYDENIMTAVAKAGRGKYYFMEDPTQAEQIFSEEFKTLGSVVARDIEVSLDLGPDFEVKRGVGYEMTAKNTFHPHNLSLGHDASYLFEVAAHTNRTGGTVLGTVKTTYFNVSTGRKETVAIPVKVELTTQDVNPLSDSDVYQEFMRSHIAEQMWQVDQDLNQVRNDDARKVLESSLQDLEYAAKRMPGVFGDELSKMRSKKVFLEAQGSRDVQQVESGRIFKKMNQSDSFSVQYNR